MGIFKYTFKIQYILNIGASEFVNGLVIISYYTQILILAGQNANQLKLYRIGILILIHHNITESLLVILQNVWLCLQKLHRLHQQIVKIQRIVGAHLFFIFPIHFGNLLLMVIPYRIQLIFLRCDIFILRRRNGCQEISFFINLCINLKKLAHILHHGLLVICIVNGEIRIVPQPINVTSQNSYTSRVKCADPNAL